MRIDGANPTIILDAQTAKRSLEFIDHLIDVLLTGMPRASAARSMLIPCSSVPVKKTSHSSLPIEFREVSTTRVV
jgi:hypothetical protein